MEPQNPTADDGQRQPSKWCDLPKDLLLKISNKLVFSSNIHLTRIRSVCSQWRSSIPLDLPSSLHFHIPVPPIDPQTPLALVDTLFHLLSPPPGCGSDAPWLARMCSIQLGKWHVFNPVNIHDYFYAKPPLVGSINLLDSDVLELSRTFSLIDANDQITNPVPLSRKVAGGWNLGCGFRFGVLALLESKHGGGLWLWRLGDKEWLEIEGTSCTKDHICVHHIGDIAYHDGKFYAFELSRWQIGVIDPNSDSGSVTMEFFDGPADMFDGLNDEDKYLLKFNGRSYLISGVYFVSSNGCLYLVVEAAFPESRPKCVDLALVMSGQVDLESFFGDDDDYDEEEMGPKSTLFVFLMKEKDEVKQGLSGVWEQVNSIGDQVFFIGYDTCFAVSSASVNLPRWKPSSICLFTRTSPLLLDGFSVRDGDDEDDRVPEGLRSMKSMTYPTYWRYFRLFEMGEEDKGVVNFEKFPLDVYTGLFFPPPPWVEWRCPDHDNVGVSFEGLKFSEL